MCSKFLLEFRNLVVLVLFLQNGSTARPSVKEIVYPLFADCLLAGRKLFGTHFTHYTRNETAAVNWKDDSVQWFPVYSSHEGSFWSIAKLLI